MMDTRTAYALFVDPALVFLAAQGGPPRNQAADHLLLATMVQESNLSARLQNGGPARSFYQFEKISIIDVLTRARTAEMARKVCELLVTKVDPAAVFDAVADNDVLATCFARLNYWNSRLPLPATEAEGWLCYKSTWKPGKPDPDRWPRAWALAGNALA